MRTAISTIELLQPKSLKEALMMLRNEGPLTPLAGCTDVLVNLNFGTALGPRPKDGVGRNERRFVDLWGLPGLTKIALRRNTLSIGALATYTDLMRSALVRKRLPMLALAARQVGGPQIQNRGTLGGNIANASPAGDTLPVLAAVNAVVVLASADGQRRIPITDFYTGYRQTQRRPDELIVSVEIPKVEGKQWFRKVGTRAAQAISKVVMAGVRAKQPRIALGSVGPTVVRARKTEEALASSGSLEAAQAALLSEISPIDDIRSTCDYRKQVSANLLARFWSETA